MNGPVNTPTTRYPVMSGMPRYRAYPPSLALATDTTKKMNQDPLVRPWNCTNGCRSVLVLTPPPSSGVVPLEDMPTATGKGRETRATEGRGGKDGTQIRKAM